MPEVKRGTNSGCWILCKKCATIIRHRISSKSALKTRTRPRPPRSLQHEVRRLLHSEGTNQMTNRLKSVSTQYRGSLNAMKNLSSFDSFENESLTSVRPVVMSALMLGSILCIFVTGATTFFLGHIGGESILWIASALLSTSACYFSQSRTALSFCGSIGAICIAGSLGVLTKYSSEPGRWFLSDGLVITMVLTFLCHGVLEYLVAAVFVWVVLALVVPVDVNTSIDKLYLIMTLSGSLLLGVVMAILFHGVRKDNFLLREKLKELALIDALTGLPNRRCFLSQIETMETQEASLGDFFFMVDIDNFKRINDDFGHDVGDEALKKIADVISQASENHICARLGGEEFAIYGRFKEAAALSLAASINASASSCAIRDRQLTVSVGVARRLDSEPYSVLMKRADESLYIAKSTGKNKYHYAISEGQANLG
jgi:diguanylate cyclase (GGDEF)-like protein